MITLNINKPTENITLLQYLTKAGYTVSADCAGLGTCGKCKVKVISGEFVCVNTNEPYLPDEYGFILSCKAILKSSQAVIEVPNDACSDNAFVKERDENLSAKNLSVALDIGTTTLCAALIDSDKKEVVKTVSALNPQKNFGADVMSRITASKKSLSDLQSVLLSKIRNMISDLTSQSIQTLAVTGNTTMLHLFCGISPLKMGTYPFTPEFLELKVFSGNELNLNAEKVYVLPSASAFIGSDVTSALVYLDILEQKNPCVLLDIGTNGEMVLFTGTNNGSKLFATSSAAGPALEGVGVSCGSGGVTGAINKVELNNNEIEFSTINNAAPTGICTSGLIDLIAALLKNGMLDETGYLECEQFDIYANDNTTVFINQDDVRSIQLAKSAIRAALDTLLFDNGFDYARIEKIYLSGGIGYYLNPQNAAKIGLFPQNVADKIKPMGNTSLLGAAEYIIAPEKREILSEICNKITTIELNKSETFNNAFIEHMYF